MVLINADDIHNDQILKYVKKINQFHEKGKTDKVISLANDLVGFMKDENSEICRDAVFIYSLMIEEFPDLLKGKIEKRISNLLQSEDEETRLNSVIIWGHILLNKLNSGEEIDGEAIDEFILFTIEEKVPEIQANLIFILEEFPSDYFDYIIPKIPEFLEILNNNQVEGVFESVLNILSYIWETSLEIKISIFNSLSNIYINNEDYDKRKAILDFLSKGIPQLKEQINLKAENNKEFSEDDFIQFLEERIPLTKIYDIQKIAKEEGMDIKDVEESFKQIKGNKDIFGFLFQDKKKYFIELEIKPLIKFLKNKKVAIDDLIKIFENATFDAIAAINLLIKKLVKAKIIKGYLTKSYFYSYEYIKNQMLNDIRRNGKINIDEYAKSINHNFLIEIVTNINMESKFTGIFTKNKSEFLTLSSIMKEIERYCVKESMFNLSNYKEIYSEEDYKLIEDECRKKFFTEYHIGSNWLTNIGHTRVTTECRNGQLIGYIDSNKISEKTRIPIEIVSKIVEKWIEAKPGIWDNSHTIYYFMNYIKSKIKLLQSIEDEDKRNEMIQNIANELNIGIEEIQQKLKQEKEEIIKQIKEKPYIDISVYTRALGMKRQEFIDFVNSLNIEYLIQENQMIFDKRRINKKRQDIKMAILDLGRRKYTLRISELSRQFHISEKVILEIINSLYDIKSRNPNKLQGILIDPDLFLTVEGIKRRIRDTPDYISPETIVPERPLTKDEENLVVKILESMINKGILSGIYDEQTHVFKSEDVKNLEEYVKSKSNVEDILDVYVNYMFDTYKKVKESIVDREDIFPGDLKRIDYLIKRVIDQLQNWEYNLREAIKKAQKSYEDLESIDEDITFEDILDFEEEKVKKIDSEKIMQKFNNWKQLIYDLEQTVPLIVKAKKKLLDSPDDESLLEELNNLYDKVQFNSDKISFKKKKS
ncbi:MAG: hypothetical protein ACTSRZ_04585 [Promethearchaeota archaeon]